MNTIGERLKIVRGEHSQAVFSKRLGIPQSTLSNYESGRNKPDFDLIDKICCDFGVNVEWFLFGRGPMLKEQPGQEANSASTVVVEGTLTFAGMQAAIKVLEEELVKAKEAEKAALIEAKEAYKTAFEAARASLGNSKEHSDSSPPTDKGV